MNSLLLLVACVTAAFTAFSSLTSRQYLFLSLLFMCLAILASYKGAIALFLIFIVLQIIVLVKRGIVMSRGY